MNKALVVTEKIGVQLFIQMNQVWLNLHYTKTIFPHIMFVWQISPDKWPGCFTRLGLSKINTQRLCIRGWDTRSIVTCRSWWCSLLQLPKQIWSRLQETLGFCEPMVMTYQMKVATWSERYFYPALTCKLWIENSYKFTAIVQ